MVLRNWFTSTSVPGALFVPRGGAAQDDEPIPTKGIFSSPTGRYVFGVAVPAGPGSRVFIYQSDQKMHAVPLTVDEEDSLTPESTRRLENTDVWRDKLSPSLEKADWTKAQKRH
ncbi:MAG: hypothetical protein DWI21_17090 [Planctomycetota bacterium]|nr:MAG: hypothetical protein DWI21_17090 [Planctomycetota bacterium]